MHGCGHKYRPRESVWGVVKCMGVVTSVGNQSGNPACQHHSLAHAAPPRKFGRVWLPQHTKVVLMECN